MGQPKTRGLEDAGLILAGVVPMLVCIAEMSPHGHWGASRRLVTSTLKLDGQFPLAAMASRAVAQLPFAAVDFRIGLATAAVAALAGASCFAALRKALGAAGLSDGRAAVPLSVGVTLWILSAPVLLAAVLDTAPAVWTGALTVVLVERLVSVETHGRPGAAAAWHAAGVLGLGVAHAPAWFAVAALASLPTLARGVGASVTPARCLGMFCLGLGALAPALVRPASDLPAGELSPGPHPAIPLGIVAGVLLLRWVAARRPLAAVNAKRLPTLLGACVLVLGLSLLLQTGGVLGQRQFDAHTVMLDQMLNECPPRSLLLTQQPVHADALAAHESVNPTRPDIERYHARGEVDPGTLPSAPGLRGVLRAYLLTGALSEVELQSLATRRPVRIQMHGALPSALYETLVPIGLLYAVEASTATRQDVHLAAERQRAIHTGLATRFDITALQPVSRALLAHGNHTDALFYLERDDREAAAFALEFATALAPRARPLERTRAALGDIETVFDISALSAPWQAFVP